MTLFKLEATFPVSKADDRLSMCSDAAAADDDDDNDDDVADK